MSLTREQLNAVLRWEGKPERIKLTEDELRALIHWFEQDPNYLRGDSVPERQQYFAHTLFPAMREACRQYGVAAPKWLPTKVRRVIYLRKDRT